MLDQLLALLPRDDCTDSQASNTCEKPAISSVVTPIVVGTISGVFVVGLFSILIFLHLRRQRRDKKEWAKYSEEMEDYGVVNSPTKPSNRSKWPNATADPEAGRRGQMPTQSAEQLENPFETPAEARLRDDGRR